MSTILQVNHLTKRYGSLTALDGMDLTVESGQVFGILGPNGSGKTTMLGIILDVIHAQSGTYEWFEGEDVQSARSRIGALLETPNFYPYLNADQNLSIVAHIKKVEDPALDPLLNLVQLKDRRRSKYSTYSLGMKQRLALAACLVGDPDVLILDEPTNGLDPQGMIEVRNVILKIAEQGKTIIIASHLLDEVEKICSHVAILKQGRRLATGAVGSILSSKPTIEVGCPVPDQSKLDDFLKKSPAVTGFQMDGSHFIVELKEGHDLTALNRDAFEAGITLNHMVSKARSLELEFLEITK